MKKPAWNKGIDHLSPDAKKRIGEATKKRFLEKGHPKGMLGKKHTKETIARQKMWRPNDEQKKLMVHHKENHPLWKGDDVEKQCEQCEKTFTIRPQSKQRFCSKNCVYLSRQKAKEFKDCLNCGTKISITTKLVCRPCFPEYYIGDKKSSWRGGLTSINKMVRNSDQMAIWRNAIFERDDYTCQICGERGNKLNADHHPMSLSEIIITYNIKGLKDARNCPQIWDTNNGRTLCVPCHKTTETYGFKKYQLKKPL